MITIATRGSALALWQAEHVSARLQATRPGLAVELLVIKTRGDKILDVPLAQVGGKGLFIKEIEEALVDGRADLAVHSLKDMTAELAPGLTLAAVSRREDPRDALVSRDGLGLTALPPGARVGTSSVRRICQLRAVRRDLEIVPLRGNVDTRLRKLDAGELDAVILAAAGLLRLGYGGRISELLDPVRFVPAIGQGVLALETRAGDAGTIELVRAALHDPDAASCVGLERAFLERLSGGCQTPIACHAVLDGRDLVAAGFVGDVAGTEVLRAQTRGDRERGAEMGRALAESLLAVGADRLLGSRDRA